MANDNINMMVLLCAVLILLRLIQYSPVALARDKVVSLLTMTHSLKNHVILALMGEREDSVINNACNLFHQNPDTSVLLLWNDENKDFVVFDGARQEVTSDTLLYIVGHGGEPGNENHPVQLGGCPPEKLAWMVSKLPMIHSKTIGHINLVACYIHRRTEGNDSFLQRFLDTLASCYSITTSVSAWTMEVAVDPEGRLVSRFNSTSSWLINYPGSIAVASLGQRKQHRRKEDWTGGYDSQHDGDNPDLEQVMDYQTFAGTGVIEQANKPQPAAASDDTSTTAGHSEDLDCEDGQHGYYHQFNSNGHCWDETDDDDGDETGGDRDQVMITDRADCNITGSNTD